MDEDINPALGISRRDLLRRGAVVGGTLVWAAPAVQSISRAALAQDSGTPAPGAISYVALVLTYADDTTVRVKYEVDTGWDPEPGKTPQCVEPAAWDAATPKDGGVLGIVVTGNSSRLCFDLSATNPLCTFGSGTSMGAAGEDHPQESGFCTGPDAGWTPTFVCFSDPNP